jgi:hypothetical protein
MLYLSLTFASFLSCFFSPLPCHTSFHTLSLLNLPLMLFLFIICPSFFLASFLLYLFVLHFIHNIFFISHPPFFAHLTHSSFHASSLLYILSLLSIPCFSFTFSASFPFLVSLSLSLLFLLSLLSILISPLPPQPPLHSYLFFTSSSSFPFLFSFTSLASFPFLISFTSAASFSFLISPLPPQPPFHSLSPLPPQPPFHSLFLIYLLYNNLLFMLHLSCTSISFISCFISPVYLHVLPFLPDLYFFSHILRYSLSLRFTQLSFYMLN